MFVLGSDITVGNFRFGGVHEVRVKRSVHSYVNTATIVIPSVARIVRKDGRTDPDSIVCGKQFKDGDPVVIRLGYNGNLVEEFRGFVKRRDLNMPLEIECEGYSYVLRNTKAPGVSYKSTTVKQVLTTALDGTGIKLIVANDIDLVNILIKDCTVAEVLDYVIKASEGALNAFFISHDTLWVGMIYLPNADGITGVGVNSQVKFRLGYNVIKDNSLKERIPNVDVEIRIKTQKTKRVKGDPVPVKMGEAGKVRKVLLQHIKPAAIQAIVASLQAKENYTGYEGKVTCFLVPYAEPGYKAFITDTRYKERDGVFFIEGTEVVYGMGGARRMVEIGPKIQA